MAQIPFFGRAWSITIQPQGGDPIVLTDESSLRVTFTVDTVMLMEFWKATITIYNLGAATQNQLLASGVPINKLSSLTADISIGAPVSISAGYKSGQSGSFDTSANLIYQGNLFQPLWTRENVVDSRLTLRCILGLVQSAINFASVSIDKGKTPLDAINAITKNANLPDAVIDAKTQAVLTAKTFSRGQTFHDRPVPALQQIVKENNLIAWLAPNGLNIQSMDIDQTKAPTYIYGPPVAAKSNPSAGSGSTPVTRTLIGVPDQTQDGIVFRVLMDARPKIADIVQLVDTAVNGFQFPVPGLPAVPNPSLTYFIAGIRHVGDSRGHGNDWYTEITGLTMQFLPQYLLSITASQQSDKTSQ